MFTASDAIAKLDTLGSPRQIADHLLERGCKGWPSDLSRCPVARYVAMETVTAIGVGGAEWGAATDSIHDAVQTFELPANVEGFVFGFDRGVYPDLICDEFHDEVRRELWEDAQRQGIPADQFEAWANGQVDPAVCRIVTPEFDHHLPVEA